MSKPKILIIGQALPDVEQSLPYDTTMLYDWLTEAAGVGPIQAQREFEFDAVFPGFPGYDKNGGHNKPTKNQMLVHWNNALETKVQLADKVWVLGNVAKEFIEKQPKTWSCNTEFLFTMHPSRRNYHKFTLCREELISKLRAFYYA